ncbi:MAG: HPr(Ser) kinase/phosphatase [Clostridia bacterium]|nr:HPr(Ser) kinase/phosphatase [Clostridia bacterium]
MENKVNAPNGGEYYSGTEKVSVKNFAKALELEVYYEGRGELLLQSLNVSRPGLQLAGYFKHFDHARIQVIGKVEYEYLLSCPAAERQNNLDQLFSRDIPCIIFSRGLEVLNDVREAAEKYSCPIFRSDKITTILINDITIYQNELLAQTKVVHGVLVDVFGIGILIMGKSGVGKSEIALELVNRGHRLVADDSVIIKNINDQLIGKAPEKIRYYMEIRGIGIINVQQMFGPGSIRPEKGIDIIAELSPWEEGKHYDRIGNEDMYEEILGIEKLKIVIPVTPGRNIPIVLETAARKYRLKQAGYDAAKDLMESIFGDNN